MTWYPQSYIAKVPMTNMDLRADPSRGYPGRTYRFYKGPVVFSYGHGLSYTSFTNTLAKLPPKQVSVSLATTTTLYSNLDMSNISSHGIKVSHTNCNVPTMDVHVDVKNTGDMDGTHTLLVYSTPPGHTNKKLIGFHKVHVPAKSTQTVKVDIHVCEHLSVVDRFGIRRIPMGEHNIHIGDDLIHTVSLQASREEIKS